MLNKTRPILFLDHHDPVLRKTATCDHDCAYVDWHIEERAARRAHECSICEKEVDRGWLCLDGGQLYCDDCVIVADDLEFDDRSIQLLCSAMDEASLDNTAIKDQLTVLDFGNAVRDLKRLCQWLRSHEIKVHNVRNYVDSITGVK